MMMMLSVGLEQSECFLWVVAWNGAANTSSSQHQRVAASRGLFVLGVTDYVVSTNFLYHSLASVAFRFAYIRR